MKKKMMVGILSTVMAMSMSMTALAGQWQSDANGWWYQNDDGSYPTGTWQWIDGDNDGTAESYYFNSQGYCLMNTTTPDGYTVNPAGAWIVDGMVQTKIVESTNQTQTQNQNQTQNQTPDVPAVDLLDLKPVASNSYNKFTNKYTVQGDLWSKGFYLHSNNFYVEFYAGAKYQTFTATLGVMQNDYTKTDMTVEVYGDDDVLLDSFRLDLHTEPMKISVDISGQNYIKIINTRNNGHGFAMFKNAQFK